MQINLDHSKISLTITDNSFFTDYRDIGTVTWPEISGYEFWNGSLLKPATLQITMHNNQKLLIYKFKVGNRTDTASLKQFVNILESHHKEFTKNDTSGIPSKHVTTAYDKPTGPDQPNKKALKCPKCGSTNLQMLGDDSNKFSIGKAAVGALAVGGIGALAGFKGKKGKKYEFACLNCQHKFQVKF